MEPNITNYDNFIKYLLSLKDEKYLHFQKKIVQTDYFMIGIRIPILKNIAKQITKNYYDFYLNNCTFKYYEEIIIYGLILGFGKKKFKNIEKNILILAKHVDNWAICDTVIANLKQVKYEKEIWLKFIYRYINNNNQYLVRICLVLLLDFYIEKEYLKIIFNITDNLKREEYYIKMAVAWLISICYIKHEQETLKYLINNKLDDWTYNKTIQKIIESKRIGEETRKKLKEMKRLK